MVALFFLQLFLGKHLTIKLKCALRDEYKTTNRCRQKNEIVQVWMRDTQLLKTCNVFHVPWNTEENYCYLFYDLEEGMEQPIRLF